ncbi:MAG: signal peptidase II, partial [Rhodoferax sp.]|nr:signal peptidase II [Rhodoferax sp.]
MARHRGGLRLLHWLAMALLIVLVDQFTKLLIVGSMQLGDSRMVTDYFNIVRAHNSGAAFSFLADASGWQRWFFTGLGSVAAVFMVWLLRSHAG